MIRTTSKWFQYYWYLVRIRIPKEVTMRVSPEGPSPREQRGIFGLWGVGWGEQTLETMNGLNKTQGIKLHGRFRKQRID